MVGMRERGEVYDFMVNLVSKVTKKFDASLGPFLSVMMPIGIINTEKLHLTLKKVANGGRAIPKNSIDSLDPSQIWRRQIQAVHRFVTTKAFK